MPDENCQGAKVSDSIYNLSKRVKRKRERVRERKREGKRERG
jgi:hypothetical protein